MPSGGARKGTGPKKQIKVFSDAIRKNYLQADKYFASYLAGKDIIPKRITSELITVGFIHGLVWMRGSKTWVPAKIQDSVRVAAQKVRQEALCVKETKSTIEHREYGPSIGLPPMKEKPKEPDHFIPVERPN